MVRSKWGGPVAELRPTSTAEAIEMAIDQADKQQPFVMHAVRELPLPQPGPPKITMRSMLDGAKERVQELRTRAQDITRQQECLAAELKLHAEEEEALERVIALLEPK